MPDHGSQLLVCALRETAAVWRSPMMTKKGEGMNRRKEVQSEWGFIGDVLKIALGADSGVT